MRSLRKLTVGAAVTALAVVGTTATMTAPANARVVIGLGFGVPGPWYYPPAYYYPPCYPYYCGYPAYYGGGGGWVWFGGRWQWRGGFRDRDDFRFRDRDDRGFRDRDDRGFHGGMHGR